jgi:hypothetical protein
MPNHSLLLLTFYLFVHFMLLVDLPMQQIYLPRQHSQLLFVLADRIVLGIHPLVDNFRQPKYLVILEGSRILQIHHSIFNILVILFYMPIFLHN